jgi:glucosylglycerate phosphorylase
MADTTDRIREKLSQLYGDDRADKLTQRVLDLISQTPVATREPAPLTERDVVLITYGDMVKRRLERPLDTLRRFLEATAKPQINTVHLLPFYPYTSDDGFSVVDYFAVDPALGTWDDVKAFKPAFRIMFDAVFNHISASSAWFQGFLRGEAPYTDYFVTADPTADFSKVRRPRALPLLTKFQTANGEKHVWTTFSADQIDLNIANPEVLLELLRALLFYVQQGADLIRLDAIAFLWKTIGTDCIHLPETHLVVQLMRDVLDMAAPDVLLVTETNVPHHENVSYFGDGTNEAQMVYQFSLPPLLLHTFRTGDVTRLAAWAKTIERTSDQTTFFNFCASHDGIGVTPARGLLSDDEIDAMLKMVETHGGRISIKANSDGTHSPYEMNITYFDAITDPAVTINDPETTVRRFLCSQAIMLALVGVPGIYFHSLYGSRNWDDGVASLGHNRAINREKFDVDALLGELGRPETIRANVYHGYKALLNVRTSEPAFHPMGGQRVLDYGAGIFGVERTSPDGTDRVIALHNVTGETASVILAQGVTDGEGAGAVYRDLLSGETVSGSTVEIAPYSVLWLKAVQETDKP